MTFIGFILSEKPLREILASSDPSEFLVPMTAWEPDRSIPPDRFGLNGLALDGSLNFYADVELEPEKLYYYWTFAANAVGHTSGSPKKLKTPSDKVHWWSKDNLLAGGWRNSFWLGTFRPHASGWIYHAKLIWSFAHPDGNSGLWLWLKKEGWLWTHPKLSLSLAPQNQNLGLPLRKGKRSAFVYRMVSPMKKLRSALKSQLANGQLSLVSFPRP